MDANFVRNLSLTPSAPARFHITVGSKPSLWAHSSSRVITKIEKISPPSTSTVRDMDDEGARPVTVRAVKRRRGVAICNTSCRCGRRGQPDT
jgi:hypothetical protein